MCSLLLFILIIIFGHILLLFDYLSILFRLALWTSAGKERTAWLSACAVLLYVVLIVCVPFPYGDWGRMWKSIVSIHDHRLFYLLWCK